LHQSQVQEKNLKDFEGEMVRENEITVEDD